MHYLGYGIIRSQHEIQKTQSINLDIFIKVEINAEINAATNRSNFIYTDRTVIVFHWSGVL